jgi:hypothetical protein
LTDREPMNWLRVFQIGLNLLYAPLAIPLVYCHIKSFQRASSVARPSPGGEKRTAVWASHHEERGSDGAVAPPMCDHRVVLHRCVVREWCHPSGSAVATCLHAAARTRRAARAVQGDVVSVWQVLHGTPSAPPISAQRVARFDDHCTRNCLLQNKLRQRYSRSRQGGGLWERREKSGFSFPPVMPIRITTGS